MPDRKPVNQAAANAFAQLLGEAIDRHVDYSESPRPIVLTDLNSQLRSAGIAPSRLASWFAGQQIPDNKDFTLLLDKLAGSDAEEKAALKRACNQTYHAPEPRKGNGHAKGVTTARMTTHLKTLPLPEISVRLLRCTSVAEFIETYRNCFRLSQEEVAESIGVTDYPISKWERGLSLPDEDNLEHLKTLLGRQGIKTCQQHLETLVTNARRLRAAQGIFADTSQVTGQQIYHLPAACCAAEISNFLKEVTAPDVASLQARPLPAGALIQSRGLYLQFLRNALNIKKGDIPVADLTALVTIEEDRYPHPNSDLPARYRFYLEAELERSGKFPELSALIKQSQTRIAALPATRPEKTHVQAVQAANEGKARGR